MYRVRRHFGGVEVEDLGQDFEGEAGREPVHAFHHASGVTVLLDGFGFRVGILDVLAVINPHLGEDAGVFRLLDAREHRELGQHVQGVWRAGSAFERTVAEQFLVDLDFFRHPHTIGHLDDIDPVKERLVVLVVAEGLPLRFVGVGQDHTVEGDRAHAFGGVVVAFLGRRQQWVQDFDGCLEHLHEFHQALVGLAQATAEAVGIRIVLGEILQHADVDLADEGGNVLVVVVTGLGLGNSNLVEHRGIHFHNPELADVAAVLMQAFHGPGRHDVFQVTCRNPVFLFEDLGVFGGIEQTQGRFVYWRALDSVERHFLHQ